MKFHDYLKMADVRKSELKDRINPSLTDSLSQLDQKADDSIQSLRSEFVERLEGQSSIHSQQLSSLNKSVEENSMDVALCKDILDALRLQVDSVAHVGFSITTLHPTDRSRPNVATAARPRTPIILNINKGRNLTVTPATRDSTDFVSNYTLPRNPQG